MGRAAVLEELQIELDIIGQTLLLGLLLQHLVAKMCLRDRYMTAFERNFSTDSTDSFASDDTDCDAASCDSTEDDF